PPPGTAPPPRVSPRHACLYGIGGIPDVLRVDVPADADGKLFPQALLRSRARAPHQEDGVLVTEHDVRDDLLQAGIVLHPIARGEEGVGRDRGQVPLDALAGETV